MCNFIEQFDQQVILSDFGFSMIHIPFIQACQIIVKVSHQTAHHASGQSGTDEQRIHHPVFGIDVISQEVIHKALSERTGVHISFHVNFWNFKTCILQHSLHGKHIRMTCSPGKWLHANINIFSACAGNFQN